MQWTLTWIISPLWISDTMFAWNIIKALANESYRQKSASYHDSKPIVKVCSALNSEGKTMEKRTLTWINFLTNSPKAEVTALSFFQKLIYPTLKDSIHCIP